jgi:antitoxin SocA-like protein
MTKTREMPTSSNTPSFVKQVLPFNQFRFEDCMAYLSAKHDRELSVYELMKLHVMIDVFHTISRGKPVIGGTFSAFRSGPVSRTAKHHVREWLDLYEEGSETPELFDATEKDADRTYFKAKESPDPDEFSKSELDAMDKAWETVIPLLDESFKKSQDYFHKDSPVGKAWLCAKKAGRELNWNDIIDEFNQDTGRNHSHLKTIMQL